jgi:hypothetical protein
MSRSSQRLIFTAIFAVAAIAFFTGINWGLPSRESDPLLFGSRVPWTGDQITALAGAWDESAGRGADIAMHPLVDRSKPVELNDTDAKRAEIVRRYRLYSSQPDEMITFRSLSGMKPGRLKLDPKMYQYGGLWIYPVGGLLKIASLLHLVTLRTDLAFYLDHPEAFARFYLVARIYSALWGLLGVWVVCRLGREWTGRFLVGAAAAGMFASMPVVIDLAHEAKPHLAGTVLILLTILAALRYVRSGGRRWLILAGVFAGAAMGMVLTGYVAFAVLPVMALLGEKSWRRRIIIAGASGLVGIAIFALTNPYLPFNVLFHRELLHSNVGNYGTFYQPRLSLSAIVVTGRSIFDGLSLAPTVVGGIAICALWFIRDTGLGPVSRQRTGFLLAGPAVIVLLQMVLLARGKTAEYARFGLLPDVAIAIAAAALVGSIDLKPKEKAMTAVLLAGATLFYGFRYDLNFVLDGRDDSTRRAAARVIGTCQQQTQTLAVWAEPAPYCLPPVDLFTWRIVLLPAGGELTPIPPGAIAVRPVDEPSSLPRLPHGIRQFKPANEIARPSSPISWANKPFEILGTTRRAVSQPAARP